MKTTMTDDHGIESRETRVLPAGGDSNIICGRIGYAKEMAFRRARIKEGIPYELPKWNDLKVYFKDGIYMA